MKQVRMNLVGDYGSSASEDDEPQACAATKAESTVKLRLPSAVDLLSDLPGRLSNHGMTHLLMRSSTQTTPKSKKRTKRNGTSKSGTKPQGRL